MLGELMSQKYDFNIHTAYAPLAITLPNHTAIYHRWPRKDQRAHLPDYLSIAATTTASNNFKLISEEDDEEINNDESIDYLLMGDTIHVVQGQRLEVNLVNTLQATGLSLHFHGFEMKDSLVYDGVVGVTQCAVSPDSAFVYNFTVDETPGTYWYHTHSGELGINSHDAIKGPLIVHPSNSVIDSSHNNEILRSPLSYGNDRILFFSDGYSVSDSHAQLSQLGGLNPSVSKSDDGFTIGSFPFEFGACNGKLREVVNVIAGETYKMRLINGGSLYSYRIFIQDFKMTIVAADSEPVEPFEVDEVILHTGERFDVEIAIPSNTAGGKTFWIRADTLESVKQGYEVSIMQMGNLLFSAK